MCCLSSTNVARFDEWKDDPLFIEDLMRMLDNTLEFLHMNGMPLPLAGMALLPEPWQGQAETTPWRDLYRYYATMMEPWDGPASLLFSDGDIVGAVLDRNGLRPSRYYITDDKILII